jgi:hypothetical protein
MKTTNFHDIPEMRGLLEDFGPKVFHYTTAQGLLGIVGTRSMYASGVVHLGDATELKYSHQVILETIEGFDSGTNVLVVRALSKLKELWTLVGMGLTQGQFVLSFSKTDNDAGQWERYAGPTGFVIGFDGLELLNVLISQGLFFPVSYDRQVQTAIVRAILSQHLADPEVDLREVEETSGDPLASFYLLNSLLVTSRLFKHEAFRSESEVRFVQTSLVPDTELFHKVGPYGLAAYKEISLIDTNGKIPITDIVYPFSGEPDELGWTIALLIHKHRDCLGDVEHRSTTFKLRASPRR